VVQILGLLELAVVLSIAVAAAPNAARLVIISPSTEAVSLLPLVLLPLTMIPLVVALHITSLRILMACRRWLLKLSEIASLTDHRQPRPHHDDCRSQTARRIAMPLPEGLQNSHQSGGRVFPHLRGGSDNRTVVHDWSPERDTSDWTRCLDSRRWMVWPSGRSRAMLRCSATPRD
jgi:hypothetical protein